MLLCGDLFFRLMRGLYAKPLMRNLGTGKNWLCNAVLALETINMCQCWGLCLCAMYKYGLLLHDYTYVQCLMCRLDGSVQPLKLARLIARLVN